MSLTPRAGDDGVWPSLPYAEWQQTCSTLHMWTQVVGKVKLELTHFLNDWWNVAFAVTARGLTTATIPYGQRMFQVNFDFIDHGLAIHVSDGNSRRMALRTVSHDRSSAAHSRQDSKCPSISADAFFVVDQEVTTTSGFSAASFS